ncbi:hypothetical protein [Mycoplasma todarodis]|uniref:Uncharacterized protein n=1 Tax=Mycoplasma todarodis TaxID=1937191 RepID=A0A4R0XYC6_9MOLU|nr:hypothetical protein [Mycoplasma todarodis]TCG12069.1 hypothetical protein C4B25_00040 [Mycoplasma todarodis]
MKENLDIFPALYYSLYKQNKKETDKEYGVDDFIKIHYSIIKRIQKILLIKKKAINIFGNGVKIQGREVKKTLLLKPKTLTWEKEEPIVGDYWTKLMEYIEKKLQEKVNINFLNLFFIENSSKNEKLALTFEIY